MSNLGERSISIDVPFKEQEEGDECVIACCVMMLEWASQRFSSGGIPKMSYEDVKALMKIETGGLPLSAPKRLNRCKQLKKSVPRVRFAYSLWNKLEDILKELEKDYPVTVWIEQEAFGDRYFHSIVVNGVSEDKMEIAYLDPNPEMTPFQVNIPTSKFLEQWQCTLNALIKIDIIEDPLLLLPDYFENEQESERK